LACLGQGSILLLEWVGRAWTAHVASYQGRQVDVKFICRTERASSRGLLSRTSNPAPAIAVLSSYG
jgi:hypothetical protein